MKNINGDEFNFLIGKSIKDVNKCKKKVGYWQEVDNYILTCDDGTKIEVLTNEGCGGCYSGWSNIELEKLKNSNNVITNVICEYNSNDKEDSEDYSFKLFIYYQDDVLEINGDDGYGNGFYGGGFYITINKVEEK